MQTTEETNANGAPETPASPPEVPDWATETPDEITYRIQMTEWCTGNNEDIQTIGLTRSEFISLKRHLAKMRGFDLVPAPEGETAPTEAAGPTNGAASDRLTADLIEQIIDGLREERKFIAELHGDRGSDARSKFQADVFLLREIVRDWTDDGFPAEFPNETKLVGTIRFHVHI